MANLELIVFFNTAVLIYLVIKDIDNTSMIRRVHSHLFDGWGLIERVDKISQSLGVAFRNVNDYINK